MITRTALAIENRIALLKSRTQKDNGHIISKLERELRKFSEN